MKKLKIPSLVFIIILAILCQPCYAATRLSTASGQTLGNTGATSFTITVSIAQGQSGILYLFTQLNTHSISTVTQTNVTWTKAVSYNATTGGGDTEIWYASSAGASPGTTITVTQSLSGQAGGFEATYDTPLIDTFVDQTASNGGTGSGTYTSGTTSATTQASELWVAGFTTPDNTSAGFSYSAPTNGFSIISQADIQNLSIGLTHYGYLEKIVSTTGTASTGVTSTGITYSANIATFKFGTNNNGLLSILGNGS